MPCALSVPHMAAWAPDACAPGVIASTPAATHSRNALCLLISAADGSRIAKVVPLSEKHPS